MIKLNNKTIEAFIIVNGNKEVVLIDKSTNNIVVSIDKDDYECLKTLITLEDEDIEEDDIPNWEREYHSYDNYGED